MRSYAIIFVAALLSNVASFSCAQFTTIINVPPSIAPSSIGSSTQLNLSAGGTLPQYFTANSGSELNISGGTVGYNSKANSGSVVNVSGGSFLGYMNGATGSKFNISGGDMGEDFQAVGTTITMTGGRIGRWFGASNSVINLQNGSIEGGDAVVSKTTLNMSGGAITGFIQLNTQSTVNITGGSIGTLDVFDSTTTLSGGVNGNWTRISGGTFTIRGNDFRLGGVPVASSVGTVTFTDVLTGTFADGTPFAFSASDSDDLQGSIKLVRTALPAIGPALITVPTATAPKGIRQGQTMVVNAGGVVGNNFNAGFGSTVTIHNGATFGTNLEASGATLTIDGGTVGDGLNAFAGTTANISGGTIGKNFETAKNNTINFSGGTIGSGFQLLNGSTLNMTGGSIGADAYTNGSGATITGGTIGDGLEAWGNFALRGGSIGDSAYFAGSNTIAGGAVGDYFESRYNGSIALEGTDFRLDGVPIAGLEEIGSSKNFPISFNTQLTCILADGTPFAISTIDGDNPQSGFVLRNVGTTAIGPANLVASVDPVPLGIRNGQTLTADAGSTIPANFNPGSGSTLVVQNGATVGNNLEAFGATVNVTGGAVGERLDAFYGSTINISGGTVGSNLDVHKGGTVNISGGAVGEFLRARAGGTVNLSGGTTGQYFNAMTGSTVNISGGTTGSKFYVDSGANVTVTGGAIGPESKVRNGGNITVLGGIVGTDFTMEWGSNVTLNGGALDDSFNVEGGGILRILAGQIGDDFNTETGADVHVVGGDFRLNGVPIAGSEAEGAVTPFDIPSGAILSGVLSDGTPFAFCSSDMLANNGFDGGDDLAAGTLKLETVALPAIGLTTITAGTDAVPKGIRAGQTLVVGAGGVVPDRFNAGRGSHVEVQAGGVVGRNFEAVAATVNITGGSVGAGLDAMEGTVMNISGGTVGEVQAIGGSVLHVAGGVVGYISGFTGSEIEISDGTVAGAYLKSQAKLTVAGGRVTSSIYAEDAGEIDLNGGIILNLASDQSSGKVTISGGAIAGSMQSRGDTVEFVGGDFRLNGVPIDGLDTPGSTVRIAQYGVLTGVLSDGTPIMRSEIDSDNFGAYTLRAAAVPAVGSALIRASSDPVPLGIRQGQQLIADAGSNVLDGFKMGRGSSIRIETGATVGKYLEVVGASMTMSGGTVGTGFHVYQGGTANISGGTVGDQIWFKDGSTANIFGGKLGKSIEFDRGSTMNLFGGTVGAFLNNVTIRGSSRLNVVGGRVDTSIKISTSSAVTVSGGELRYPLTVENGTAIVSGGIAPSINVSQGTLRLVGTEFALNDVPIAGLQVGQSKLLLNRTGFLSGRLADGTTFRYSLASSGYANIVMPTSFASLFVSLVAPSIAGDFNDDGLVDSADYVVWRRSLGQTVAYGAAGDGNFDGRVDDVDLVIWRTHFGGSSGTGAANAAGANVPEPAAVTTMFLGLTAIGLGRRRRR